MPVLFLGWDDPPEEGHGNPVQYSCLENPMDTGAWQATIHRVTKSRTQLKRLSTQSQFLYINVKSSFIYS